VAVEVERGVGSYALAKKGKGEKAAALPYLWPPGVGSWMASTDFRGARHGCVRTSETHGEGKGEN
jgi:hypothetical protein